MKFVARCSRKARTKHESILDFTTPGEATYPAYKRSDRTACCWLAIISDQLSIYFWFTELESIIVGILEGIAASASSQRLPLERRAMKARFRSPSLQVLRSVRLGNVTKAVNRALQLLECLTVRLLQLPTRSTLISVVTPTDNLLKFSRTNGHQPGRRSFDRMSNRTIAPAFTRSK